MGEVLYYLKRDYALAEKRFYESNYRPPRHLFRIADCRVAMKKYDKAIEQYKEIIGFFPRARPQAYLRMGRVKLNYKKDRKGAISDFQTILKLFKGSGEASQAHRILEDLGVAQIGGGVDKE